MHGAAQLEIKYQCVNRGLYRLGIGERGFAASIICGIQKRIVGPERRSQLCACTRACFVLSFDCLLLHC